MLQSLLSGFTYRHKTLLWRVPNRFFGIRDFLSLKLGIRDSGFGIVMENEGKTRDQKPFRLKKSLTWLSKAHVKPLTCMIRTLSALWISESFASFFLSEATLLSKCSLWRAYSLWISASTPAESSWKDTMTIRQRNYAKHFNTTQFLLLGTGKKSGQWLTGA